MIAKLFAVSCVTMALMMGGCGEPTACEPKTPQVTEAPEVAETPAAAEATKAAEASKVPEAPKPAQAPMAPAARTAFRINCGDTESYTDGAGNTWAADQDWYAGRTWGVDGGMTSDRGHLGINGTDAPRVYEMERYSMYAYKFTLPDGKYTVRLHFCETYEGIMAAGERVFSVNIQGKEVLKDLDVFKEAGGPLNPLVKEFKGVSVENGQLVIGFTPSIENPEINGIEITPE